MQASANDLTIPDGMDAAEWQTRCDTAATYRLQAKYRMTDLTGGFIGGRIAGNGHFVVKPSYQFAEEVRASDLVKANLDHEVVGNGGPERRLAAHLRVNLCGAAGSERAGARAQPSFRRDRDARVRAAADVPGGVHVLPPHRVRGLRLRPEPGNLPPAGGGAGPAQGGADAPPRHADGRANPRRGGSMSPTSSTRRATSSSR